MTPDDRQALQDLLTAAVKNAVAQVEDRFSKSLQVFSERLDAYTARLGALSEKQAVQEERLNSRNGCSDPTLCIRLDERQKELEKQLERRIAAMDAEMEKLKETVTTLQGVASTFQGAKWASGLWISLAVGLGGLLQWFIANSGKVLPKLQ